MAVLHPTTAKPPNHDKRISFDLAAPSLHPSLAAALQWPAGAMVAQGWELLEAPQETSWGWTAPVRRVSPDSVLLARAEWYRGSPPLLQRLRAAVHSPPARHPTALAHHTSEGELLVVLPDVAHTPVSAQEEACALTAALAHLHDQGVSGVALERVAVGRGTNGPVLASLSHLATPANAALDVARLARRIAVLLPEQRALANDFRLDAASLWRRVELPSPTGLSPIPPTIGVAEAIEHLTDVLVPGRSTRANVVSLVAPPGHGAPRALAALSRSLRHLHGPIVAFERDDGTRRSLAARWLDAAAREVATFAPDSLREIARAVRAIAEPWAGELAALAPQLSQFHLTPDAARPEKPAPASAIAELLRVMGSARHPLVLLGQSSRPVDRLTLSVLEHLSAHPTPGYLSVGLLLVSPERSALRDLVTHEVVIDPLDLYACEELAHHALPGEISDINVIANTLLAASGGSVDRAWALLRAWRASGVVMLSHGVWRCRALPLPSVSTETMGQAAVALLQLMRVLEAPVHRSAFLDAPPLEELLLSGYLDATPSGHLHVTERGWSPEVPDTSTPSERRALHRRAVEVLHNNTPEQHLARLKHEELATAAQPSESLAVRHLQAARDMLVTGVPEQALWHLKCALARSPAPHFGAEVHRLRGLAYADLGQWNNAGAAWSTAAKESPDLLSSLAQITTGVRRLNISGAWQASTALAQTGLALAGAPVPSSHLGTVAALTSSLLRHGFWRRPHPPELRDALCGLYIPLASSTASSQPATAAYAVICALQHSSGLVSPNAAVVKACAAAALDVLDPEGFTGWSPQIMVHEALAMSEAVGTHHARAIAHHCASLVAFTQGDLEQALQHTDLSVQHALDGSRPLLAALVRLTGLAHARHHTRLPTLHEWLDQVDRIAPIFAASTTSLRLLLRARLGDPAVGTAITVHASKLATPVENTTIAWTAHTWLAEAAALNQQLEIATEQLALAEQQLARMPKRTTPGRELLLAQLAFQTAQELSGSTRELDRIRRELASWPDGNHHLAAHSLAVQLAEGALPPTEFQEKTTALCGPLPWRAFQLASAAPTDFSSARSIERSLRGSLALPRPSRQTPRDDRNMLRQLISSLERGLPEHTTLKVDLPWPLTSRIPRGLLRSVLLEQLLVATHGCAPGQAVAARIQVTPESMAGHMADRMGATSGDTVHRFVVSVAGTCAEECRPSTDTSALRELVDGLGGRVLQQANAGTTVEVWLPENPPPQQSRGVVLVVHPDRRVREALRATLSGLGHHVEAVAMPDHLTTSDAVWAFVAPDLQELVPCARVVPVIRRNEDPPMSGPSLAWPCTVDHVARQLERNP